MDDLEELTQMIYQFHEETGIDKMDMDRYRENAAAVVGKGTMYSWRDGRGEIAACCYYTPADDMASISMVFTKLAYRRRHYAENLVYEVSRIIRDKGYIPMLYTNADYTASNACYQKVGFVLRGTLCTVG